MKARDSVQMDWKCPADLKNVDEVCFAAAQELEKYSLHTKDRFAVELLLRESLNNAVIHGCHHNPGLAFSCSLMISALEVRIVVLDEGAGFDWRERPEVLLDNLAESGRGLAIYALYASSIKFNNAGNCVTLTRILNSAAAGYGKGEQDG